METIRIRKLAVILIVALFSQYNFVSADQTQERISKNIQDAPEIEIQVNQKIIVLYRQKGDFDYALDCYRKRNASFQIMETDENRKKVTIGLESRENADKMIRYLTARGTIKSAEFYQDSAINRFSLSDDDLPCAGEGTKDSPYRIANEAQLKILRENNAAYFQLEDDIVLSEEWSPIEYFYGYFDGQHHTLSNLKYSSNSTSNLGFFSNLGVNARVENLTLEYQSDEILDTSGKENAGLLAGVSEGWIRNCKMYGTIGGDAETNVGGIIGKLLNKGKVHTSFSAVNIQSAGQAGSIVGIVSDGSFVQDCYSSGQGEGINSSESNFGLIEGGTVERVFSADTAPVIEVPVPSEEPQPSFIEKKPLSHKERLSGGVPNSSSGTEKSLQQTTKEPEPLDTIKSEEETTKEEASIASENMTEEETENPAQTQTPDLETLEPENTAEPILPDYTAEPVITPQPAETLEPNEPLQETIPPEEAVDKRAELPELYRDFNFLKIWTVNPESKLPELRMSEAYVSNGLIGSGTESDPFRVSSKEDLDKVRLNLDAHYYQTADITFTEADFAAGGAFYNDGKGFEPIGNMNEFFTGEYYGEDHSIYSLHINRNDDYEAGLFGITSGQVWYLHIRNGDIKGSWAGGVVGCAAYGSHLEMLSFSGTVEGEIAGGICGGIDDSGFYDSCMNYGTIIGSDIGGISSYSRYGSVSNSFNTGKLIGTYAVGGILGSIVESAPVEACYSIGILTCDTDRIGGIVGYFDSTNIENDSSQNNYYLASPYYQGTKDGDKQGAFTPLSNAQMQSQESYVGFDFNDWWSISENNVYKFPYFMHSSVPAAAGIFLEGKGTAAEPFLIYTKNDLSNIRYNMTSHYKLMNSIFFSETDADGNSFEPIGGVFTTPGGIYIDDCFKGHFDGQGYTISGFQINQSEMSNVGLFGSVSQATLKNIHIYNADIKGDSYVGGIAGFVNQSTLEACSFNGNIQGRVNIGGIAGACDQNTLVKRCLNYGILDGYQFIGGITGYLRTSKVEDCFNCGTLTGNNYVGGITSLMEESTSWIKRTYNVGILMSNNLEIGGICAVYGANINQDIDQSSNNFYLETPWYKGTSEGDINASYQSRTESQLRNQNYYTGFDFEDVWDLSASHQYNYAVLYNVTFNPSAAEDVGYGTSFESAPLVNVTRRVSVAVDNPGEGHYYKLKNEEDKEFEFVLRLSGQEMNAVVYRENGGERDRVTGTESMEKKKLVVSLKPGETYYVVVRHNSSTQTGSYILELQKTRCLVAEASMEDNQITVSGHINDHMLRMRYLKKIFIRVFSPSNRLLAMDQIVCGTEGEYSKSFPLSELENGLYQVLVSTEENGETCRASVSYGSGESAFGYSAIHPDPIGDVNPLSVAHKYSCSFLEADSAMAYQAEITNNSKEAQTAMFLMALYDEDNMLYDYISVSSMLQPSEVSTVKLQMKTPANITGYQMKIFYLEGCDLYEGSMVPLMTPLVATPDGIQSQPPGLQLDTDLATGPVTQPASASVRSMSSGLAAQSSNDMDYSYALKMDGKYCEQYIAPDRDMMVAGNMINNAQTASNAEVINDYFKEGQWVKSSSYKKTIPVSGQAGWYTNVDTNTIDSAIFYNRDSEGQDVIPQMNLNSQTADSYGNTMAQAALVDISNDISGRVNYDNDEDYVKFTVPESGLYIISNEMENDASLMYAYLYNSAGELIEGRTNGMKPGDGIVQQLEAGQTYYLNLTAPWQGNYIFSIVKSGETISQAELSGLQVGYNDIPFRLSKNARTKKTEYTMIVYMKWENDAQAPAIGYEKQRMNFTLPAGTDGADQVFEDIPLYSNSAQNNNQKLLTTARLFEASDLEENGENAKALASNAFHALQVSDMGGKAQPVEVEFKHGKTDENGKEHYLIFDDHPEHVRPCDLMDDTSVEGLLQGTMLAKFDNLTPGIYKVFSTRSVNDDYLDFDFEHVQGNTYFDAVFYDATVNNNVTINQMWVNNKAQNIGMVYNYTFSELSSTKPRWITDVLWNQHNIIDVLFCQNGEWGGVDLMMEFEVTAGTVSFATAAYHQKPSDQTFNSWKENGNLRAPYETLETIKGKAATQETISADFQYVIDDTFPLDQETRLTFGITNQFFTNRKLDYFSTHNSSLSPGNRWNMVDSSIVRHTYQGDGIVGRNAKAGHPNGEPVSSPREDDTWIFAPSHCVDIRGKEIPEAARTGYYAGKTAFEPNEEFDKAWINSLVTDSQGNYNDAELLNNNYPEFEARQSIFTTLSRTQEYIFDETLQQLQIKRWEDNPCLNPGFGIINEYNISIYNSSEDNITRYFSYLFEGNLFNIRWQVNDGPIENLPIEQIQGAASDFVQPDPTGQYYISVAAEQVFEIPLPPNETTRIKIWVEILNSSNPTAHNAFSINVPDEMLEDKGGHVLYKRPNDNPSDGLPSKPIHVSGEAIVYPQND
ncbi:hypothetical protein [Acetivibrio sp. MSJd-27]|uniref:hypothetical protein n=1 Tax=Acetivibrio sp. MSJd-27 TaxID=2841523 RepID=UPI001C115D5C|nr:hypothetical protein [Acetivibrio sp. MSJd-27]MBU5449239.1 hypothetical protein [Acetivibrio sp. MSJd-27]